MKLTTASGVHFWEPCAEAMRGEKHSASTRQKTMRLLDTFKTQPLSGEPDSAKHIELVYLSLDAITGSGVSLAKIAKKGLFAAQGHLIGDYSAVFVALGLNVEDFEAAVLQIGQIFLQGPMELVLELRHLLGRRQNASVNAIGALRAGRREQFNLLSLKGLGSFRLVAQPGSRHEKDKDQDADDSEVVL